MKKGHPHPQIFIRILFVVISAITLSILLCSAAIYLYIEPIVRNSIISSKEEMAIKMLDQVSNSLDDVTAYATNIAFDDTVQSVLLAGIEPASYMRYSTVQRMERKLREYVILRDSLIYDIYVVDKSSRVMEIQRLHSDIFTSTVYEGLREKSQNGFTVPYRFVYNTNGGYWDTLGYVSDIFIRQPQDSNAGKLVILLNYGALTLPLRFEQESGICVELYNPAGIVFSSDPRRNLATEMAGEEHNPDYFFRYNLKSLGWYALCSVSGSQVSDSLWNMNVIIISIVAVILVVMLTVISRIITNISKPLETLVRGMRQVAKGSRTERIVVNTKDEIEEAARVFNQMVEDIDSHTQKLLDIQGKEHESRLKMLLYQINPHFIYNTLNCVICLARNEDHDSIIRLTRVFITFLRTILRVDSKSMTTLSEEITHMNNYVRILQYSYRNIKEITWEVDSGLMEVTLPKLILYPLVENSIFYGIIPSEKQGDIIVRAQRDGDAVKVSVRDTGRGFEPGALQKTCESLDDESLDHIGLSNVNSRLKMIYGEMAGLRIESEFGTGTEVSFSFLQSNFLK